MKLQNPLTPLFVIAHRLSHGMHMISGVFLVGIMTTVIVDVLTRTLFKFTDGSVNLTFPGGVEIVKYGLLFMVLFTLPYSVNRGQVVVEFFTENMSERRKSLLEGIFLIGFGFLGTGMAIRFFEATGRTFSEGLTTQDLLIPVFYIYATATFAAAVLGLRGFLVAIEEIIDSRKKP